MTKICRMFWQYLDYLLCKYKHFFKKFPSLGKKLIIFRDLKILRLLHTKVDNNYLKEFTVGDILLKEEY